MGHNWAWLGTMGHDGHHGAQQDTTAHDGAQPGTTARCGTWGWGDIWGQLTPPRQRGMWPASTAAPHTCPWGARVCTRMCMHENQAPPPSPWQDAAGGGGVGRPQGWWWRGERSWGGAQILQRKGKGGAVGAVAPRRVTPRHVSSRAKGRQRSSCRVLAPPPSPVCPPPPSRACHCGGDTSRGVPTLSPLLPPFHMSVWLFWGAHPTGTPKWCHSVRPGPHGAHAAGKGGEPK